MLLAAALLAGTAPPQCTAAAAVRTTVEEMARAPDSWFDRCVRLDGNVSWYYFYSSPRGRYRKVASDKGDHQNDGWLGLYFKDRRELQKGDSRVSLFGLVDDCTRSYERAVAKAEPGSWVMPLGYCHYQGGLTLKQVQVISRFPEDAKRETGDAARIAFGDLELPDEAHPVPTGAQRLVGQFEKSFAANDKPALLRLVYPYFTNVNTRFEKRSYEAFVSGERGPLRAFRKSALPRPQWLYARQPKDQQDRAADWFACYCRDVSCEGRWPIAALDAVASPDFPYACIRVSDWNRDEIKLSLDNVEEPYAAR